MPSSAVDDSAPLIPRFSVPTGTPDKRSPRHRMLAVYLLLLSTVLERLAFYSLAANIVLTLTTLGWNASNSVTALYIFYGISHIFTLICAVISDGLTGRAIMIMGGFVLYITGYIFITTIVAGTTGICKYNGVQDSHSGSLLHQTCGVQTLLALICSALGAGAVQSNMAVFGAEQIQQATIQSRYFDKYIFAVNIGGILATSAIPYIETTVKPLYIVFLIATLTLGIAAIVFLVSCRYSLHVKPYDTIVTKCLPVVISAWRSKRHKSSTIENELYSSNELPRTDGTLTKTRHSFLDYARVTRGGDFQDRIVNEVKALKRGVTVFALLIPFWLIYEQLDATFPLQGQQMRGSNVHHIITWMSLGDPVTIIIGIIILNLFNYKCFAIRNPASFITTKFVVGMCFAALAMWIAGVLEICRQDQCDISHKTNVSNLSIYYQLPQNIGMGVAEVFAMVASYEFAYFAAPRSAQSLLMSIRFCSLGISSFINTGYMYVFPTSFVELDFRCSTDRRWQWSFYIYFFILGGLQLLFMMILIVCQKRYNIIQLYPEKEEQTATLQH